MTKNAISTVSCLHDFWYKFYTKE